MGKRRTRSFLRSWLSRVGALAAGVATVGVLAAPGTAGAALPLPTFTVSPSTNLLPGQQVVVEWDNQFTCLTETCSTSSSARASSTLRPSTETASLAYQYPSASSGGYVVRVYQTFAPDDRTLHVCNGTGAEQCYVVLVASNTQTVKGSVPITFASSK